MLLLGVDHTTPGGLKCMQQLLPLMRSEVYEWARLLAGEQQFCCNTLLVAGGYVLVNFRVVDWWPYTARLGV
jgi:hypothetical protein